MACDCNSYINCGSPSQTVPTVSAGGSIISHNYTNETLVDNIMLFQHKITRTFNATYSSLTGQVPSFFIKCDTGDPTPCANNSTETYNSSVSENCVLETNIPYYWDQQKEIYVWKHIKESLNFSVSSTKTALFKTKWGTVKLHKIIIPNSVKTKGTEEFVLYKDSIKKILASVEYTYNPFPTSDVPGGNWGLYGNVVNNTITPDTQDVACIIVLPIPQKQAIVQDNDCLYWGFYDYNAIDGGFVENSLSKDDGGKDFFYPYWCRAMPLDNLWRETADNRYDVIYSQSKLNLEGSSNWTPTEPTVYSWPFGSFALDSKENFIASCILQFGEHASNKGVVYNYTLMGDLFEALRKTTVPLTKKFSSLYPVTPT